MVIATGRAPSRLQSIEASFPSLNVVHVPDVWLRGEAVHAQAFWKAFRKTGRPAAVLAEESPRTVTLPLLMAYCKAARIPIGLWGHFSSNYRPMGSSLLDRYRLSLASASDGCIVYTSRQAELLSQWVSHGRIVAATNTLDTATLESARRRLAEDGKVAVRDRLGLASDALTIVYIGRLIAEKGVHLLLDVLRNVQQSVQAQLVVIGDGPEREALEETIQRERLSGVHMVGGMTGLDESAPYIFAADVMLVPGYLGLQVNHAFALGVPIVGRSSPGDERFHSPEVDYIQPGKNGVLVTEPTPHAFARAVIDVAGEPSYARNALSYAQDHLSMKNMVDGLESGIKLLMQRGQKRTPAEVSQ